MRSLDVNFDVVIAGGGLSGCLSALALADLVDADGKKLSIAIIEANDLKTQAIKTFDERVLALSHGTAKYLDTVGAWQHLKTSAEGIKTIHISDRDYYGKARVYAHEHNVEALGYVCEMSAIGDALLTELKTKVDITWFCPNSIADITWHKEKVDITLDSEQVVSAKLLLACDGANSVCRKAANIATDTTQYDQAALIANIRWSKAHDNVAYERFTEHGPIAMLPLPEDTQESKKASLVWTMPPEEAQQLLELNEEAFNKSLVEAFGSWLGKIEQLGKRFVYPLNLVQAQEQVFHRMALIGNASHTIHPIAGQGFNLGVRDVAVLAKSIKQQLDNGEDIGSFRNLMEYAVDRKQDHKEIIGLTDSLVTLFSNKYEPLVLGRNIGLKVLNYVSPLKSAFVRKTMGY